MSASGAGPKQETCAERVDRKLTDRLADLRHLWGSDHDDDECKKCDNGSRYDYGLCFDYVPGGTKYNPGGGYFRFQLSTGGPGDEFRFFADAQGHVYRVEYWFLDWFDGAHRVLTGPDLRVLSDVFEDFREVGAVEKEIKDAGEPTEAEDGDEEEDDG